MVRKTASKAVATAAARHALQMPALPQELAEAAASESKSLQGRLLQGGELGKIRMTMSKKFVVDEVENDELPLIIVGYRATNAWWPAPPVDGASEPPHCAATSHYDEPCEVCGVKGCHEHLTPYENAPDQQAEECADCEQNVFGSSTTGSGRGKACKNQRLLAVLTRGAHVVSPGDDEPKLYILSVPPTGIQRFDAYVRANNAELGFPFPFGYETTVSCHPAFEYATPVFKRGDVLDADEINYYYQRAKGLSKLLERPPVQWDEQEEVPVPPPKATRKKATRKTGTRAKRA